LRDAKYIYGNTRYNALALIVHHSIFYYVIVCVGGGWSVGVSQRRYNLKKTVKKYMHFKKITCYKNLRQMCVYLRYPPF
jgi:hypothetical protein